MALPDLQEPLSRLEENDLDGAIEMLEQMVDALPAHLTAHVLLARTYEAKKEWQQALVSWENARFLMPTSPVAADGKRRVLRRMDGMDDETRSMEAPEADSPKGRGGEGEAGEEHPPHQEEPNSAETSDELEELRRQAEREARRGGARPDLASEISGTESSSAPDAAVPSPDEHGEPLEGEDDADELDHLIAELKAARIEPDPEAADAAAPELEDETAEETEPDEEEDPDEMVSATLARIHASQSNYREAARIYSALASQEPDRADEFREKAAEMERQAGSDADSTA